ncbi:MAG TPA: hypothetical protein VMY06_07835 [Sedimentisphaerales bacterium]|nr:hypothetical protein [Sedimentisphaerales bacterium]
MKRLSFSKLKIVCGLALGFVVAWAAAVPSTAAVGTIIGGYYPTGPGACCDDDHWESCTLAADGPYGAPGSLGCTSSASAQWCETPGDDPDETCHLNGTIHCVQAGDPWACNNTEGMYCD